MTENYQRMHGKTASSKVIQSLKEEPKFASELPCEVSVEQRKHVSRLRVPRTSAAGKNNGTSGKEKVIYYLWGDDRRAIRRLIEEHTQYFRHAVEGKVLVKLSSAWTDQHVELALEEWKLGGY